MSAIKDVGLFAARLREQAGASRKVLVRVADAAKGEPAIKLDGYVLLTPEEAVEVAELIESATAIVEEHGA